MNLHAYKFLIPAEDLRELPPAPGALPGTSISTSGCFAVVIAESVEQAKARFVEFSQQNGEDYRWIEVADVRELDLVAGAVLIRGMVS